MIDQLRLVRFKGFENFIVQFGGSALLVGPNNAGKSTIISALRLCASASKTARRRNPPEHFNDQGNAVWGYPMALASGSGFVVENVRHEFREIESRLELRFKSGATLTLVWPIDGQTPFFYVADPKWNPKVSAARARELLVNIGIIPTLTPVEQEEQRRDADYITDKIETRLSSRHFRNHLALRKLESQTEYLDLHDFLLTHTEELSSLEVQSAFRDSKPWVDLYYTDAGSPVEKELYWAGDGLQIWLQLLFHVWRNREAPVLVLDEPDVFLHPDLQRRLVRVLDENPQQTILASHAPEMANEAAPGTVTWIERRRKRARRISSEQGFADLGNILGTGFNLAVARALRSRVALFVEGDDMQLLRTLARRSGLTALAAERALAVVPIGGFSRWPGVEAFSWLKNEFLGDSVSVFVLLDRDYRTDAQVDEIERRMALAKVAAHVWRRKEIENYLLDLVALSKSSGAAVEVVAEYYDSATTDLAAKVEGQFVARALETAKKGVDPASTTTQALAEFRSQWAQPERRLALVPGKEAISRINDYLQAAGQRTVSARKLAQHVDLRAVPELTATLQRVDDALR